MKLQRVLALAWLLSAVVPVGAEPKGPAGWKVEVIAEQPTVNYCSVVCCFTQAANKLCADLLDQGSLISEALTLAATLSNVTPELQGLKEGPPPNAAPQKKGQTGAQLRPTRRKNTQAPVVGSAANTWVRIPILTGRLEQLVFG